jgi:hypothetical protein
MAISTSNDKLFPRDEDCWKAVYQWFLASIWRYSAELAQHEALKVVAGFDSDVFVIMAKRNVGEKCFWWL